MKLTLTEITLLRENELLHLETRHKKHFDYPLHKHTEIELNYIRHYHGLRRVIGDSVEDCKGDRELVLVGPGLEHRWEENENFEPRDTYEVTIQFSAELFDGGPFKNSNFNGIVQMMRSCRQGISFGPKAISQAEPILEEMSQLEPGFHRFQKLMLLLYELSRTEDYRLLATESFSRQHTINDNQRIEAVVNYIQAHHTEPIRLEKLAEIAYMSPTAFSHFFRLRTHKSVSDYIIDERIGHAIRLLVDRNKNILEICYECGFQNVSNFNRQFLKRRNCTPSAYRAAYQKSKAVQQAAKDYADVDEKRAEIHPR